MNNTAKILRQIREDKGMSLAEFAEFLGTSKQNIHLYETGKRSPKITLAKQIADRLGMTIEELAGIEPPQPAVSIPEELREDHDAVLLVNRFENLSEDRKKLLLDYARFLSVSQSEENGSPE